MLYEVITVADLLAGAATDALLVVVEVEAAVVLRRGSWLERHGNRLAGEELQRLQRGEKGAAILVLDQARVLRLEIGVLTDFCHRLILLAHIDCPSYNFV